MKFAEFWVNDVRGTSTCHGWELARVDQVEGAGGPKPFCRLKFNHSRFQAFVMRLMVDQQFQGREYGREIMKQLLDVFRSREQIKNVGISYEPDNVVARDLYASLGFVEPGEMLGDETLAVLNLR